jgi:hypothetical protein
MQLIVLHKNSKPPLPFRAIVYNQSQGIIQMKNNSNIDRYRAIEKSEPARGNQIDPNPQTTNIQPSWVLQPTT